MKVGCDPEFTIVDPKGNPVPAHLMGFGDKQHKTEYGWQGKYFRDGANVEVNVMADTCRGQLNRYLRLVTRAAQDTLPKGYRLKALPSYEVPNFAEVMKEAPDDFKMFGCDPWVNAYTEREERSHVDAATHPYRYSGGHLHFGTDDTKWGDVSVRDPKNHILAIKMLDLYVGIPSVVLFDTPDEFRRRQVYGKAGEFRPQRYPIAGPYNPQEVGLEYRTPSPRIFNHPALVTLFTGVGRHVLQNFEEYKASWDPALEPHIQRAINTGEGAVDLLQSPMPFYTPETIVALKLVKTIHRFHMATFQHNPEYKGWTEMATNRWRLPAFA